jgi:hypothetical protein
LGRLQAHFNSAMAVRHDIVWRGNYPEYPEPIAGLMNYIGSSPWCNDQYDPGDTGAIFDRLYSADLADVRTVLTAIYRSERFCDGGWEIYLSDGVLARVIERARHLIAGG